MNLRAFPVGIASYVPGLYRALLALKGLGGTISARYCYSVWLRHLVMTYTNGLSTQPISVAELGPGESLGVGLAALLSGANKYCSLDVIQYGDAKRNARILEELVDLFGRHEKIPDEAEWPLLKPCLESYEFPAYVLTHERLQNGLRRERIESIRSALSHPGKGTQNEPHISHFAPWYDSSIIQDASVDMIVAHTVLQHVDDLDRTYDAIYRWLKPGGFVSLEIDFKCQGVAKEWNGHWAYSDSAWRLIRGRRPYLINREPHSTHIDILQRLGFQVVCDAKTTDTSGIRRDRLAPRFRNMCEDDLTTADAFIQAVKNAPSSVTVPHKELP